MKKFWLELTEQVILCILVIPAIAPLALSHMRMMNMLKDNEIFEAIVTLFYGVLCLPYFILIIPFEVLESYGLVRVPLRFGRTFTALEVLKAAAVSTATIDKILSMTMEHHIKTGISPGLSLLRYAMPLQILKFAGVLLADKNNFPKDVALYLSTAITELNDDGYFLNEENSEMVVKVVESLRKHATLKS